MIARFDSYTRTLPTDEGEIVNRDSVYNSKTMRAHGMLNVRPKKKKGHKKKGQTADSILVCSLRTNAQRGASNSAGGPSLVVAARFISGSVCRRVAAGAMMVVISVA